MVRPLKAALIYLGFSAVWIGASYGVFEYLLPARADAIRWVHLEGLPFVVATSVLIWSVLRIEDRRLRAARARLAQSEGKAWAVENQFRRMTEGVRDYAIYMLDLDGRVISWNAGAENIKGYRSAEIVGRHFRCFYPPEDAASGKPERSLGIAREHGRFLEEGWRVRKDGSTFWASVLITSMTDEDGKLTGFSKVTRDMSAQREAEQALVAAAEQERRAHARAELAQVELQELAAALEERVAERARQLQEVNGELEAFNYTVSHDLRAPLRGMQGFAQALLEDHAEALGEEGRQYAERISRAANHMDLLIQDLLSYSRLARADIVLKNVALDVAVTQALERVEKDAREHVAEILVERPLPEVYVHLATLVHVLANLLSNAIKFVRPGEAPRVLVRAVQDGRCVRLWVEDRGIGIQPEHQARIFEVFERLHGSEAYPGSGIGLAIVKKGTERMGGRAGVESEPGRGSRFWIELARAGVK